MTLSSLVGVEKGLDLRRDDEVFDQFVERDVEQSHEQGADPVAKPLGHRSHRDEKENEVSDQSDDEVGVAKVPERRVFRAKLLPEGELFARLHPTHKRGRDDETYSHVGSGLAEK